jgi:serine/threonine-protein kinase
VSLVREIFIEPMPPPSERGISLGSAFDAWFARACHRDPWKRFETATAQVTALSEALGVHPGERLLADSAIPVSSASQASPRRRMLRPAVAVAVSVTTAAAAVAVGTMLAAGIRGASLAAPPAEAPASVENETPLPAPQALLPGAASLDSSADSLAVPALSLAPPPPATSVKGRSVPAKPIRAPDPFGDQH